jgi:hypothetical protein
VAFGRCRGAIKRRQLCAIKSGITLETSGQPRFG